MTPQETNKPDYWKLEVWGAVIILALIAFLIGADDGFKKLDQEFQHELYCKDHPMDYGCKQQKIRDNKFNN